MRHKRGRTTGEIDGLILIMSRCHNVLKIYVELCAKPARLPIYGPARLLPAKKLFKNHRDAGAQRDIIKNKPARLLMAVH